MRFYVKEAIIQIATTMCPDDGLYSHSVWSIVLQSAACTQSTSRHHERCNDTKYNRASIGFVTIIKFHTLTYDIFAESAHFSGARVVGKRGQTISSRAGYCKRSRCWGWLAKLYPHMIITRLRVCFNREISKYTHNNKGHRLVEYRAHSISFSLPPGFQVNFSPCCKGEESVGRTGTTPTPRDSQSTGS